MQALHDAAVTISLRGDLDIASEERLKHELRAAESACEVFVDLSKVTYAGTTLLNALLALRKGMRKHGEPRPIHLVGANPDIRRLLAITNLDRLFEVR